MPGITPNEGEALIAEIIYKRVLSDRDANLELGLFTNASVGETTTHAALTEPTGGSYARKDLADGSWAGTTDTRTFAAQTFTATVSAMTGDIHGYFIATKAAAGTKRLLHIERDNLKTISSITLSGSTATATCASHGLSSGNKANVTGATQTQYNGVFTITVVDANTFTYTVTGTPATPATGTIDCNRVVNMALNDNYTVNMSNVVA